MVTHGLAACNHLQLCILSGRCGKSANVCVQTRICPQACALTLLQYTLLTPAQNEKLFLTPGERFRLSGCCRGTPVLVLGQRRCGGDRQRVFLRLSAGDDDDEGSLLSDDVPAAVDHDLRRLHRREAADREHEQVRTQLVESFQVRLWRG